MKYGIHMAPFGKYSEVSALVELACEAEAAGWDGFFIWDHVIMDNRFHSIADPWVALTAMAVSTHRLRLGTLVTPLARRRPWSLARETASLDRLSNGRLTLGVGLGEPAQFEYGYFGEDTDAKRRARRLDESLEILSGLWTGKPFSFKGQEYSMEEVIFQPPPIQQPRIPIWVAAGYPHKAPMRRAARWDGIFPGKEGGMLTPDDWRDALAYIQQHRTLTTPFDAVHSGITPGDDLAHAAEIVQPYQEAGVNWWMESFEPHRYNMGWQDPWNEEVNAHVRERILQGPPRIS